MKRQARNSGFSLIELLVVIAIIAVLVGLILPAVQKVREAASRTRCANNLKQLGLAVQSYAGAFDGQLPPASFTYAPTGAQGSLLFAVLPYLEQSDLYNLYIGNGQGYLGAGAVPLSVFQCPSDPTAPGGLVNSAAISPGGQGTSTYSFSTTVFAPGQTFNQWGASSPYTVATIPDGSSNTIGFVEQAAYEPSLVYPNSWAPPALAPSNFSAPVWPDPGVLQAPYPLPQFNPSQDPSSPNFMNPAVYCQGFHPNLIMVSMMDGSVRPVTSKVTEYSWNLAIQPADGMAFDSTW